MNQVEENIKLIFCKKPDPKTYEGELKTVVEAIRNIESSLPLHLVEMLLISQNPLAGTCSLALSWFLTGLAYAHQFGVPREVLQAMKIDKVGDF